jgi:hypothetical protein
MTAGHWNLELRKTARVVTAVAALLIAVACSHAHPDSYLLDCKGAIFNANGESIRDRNVHQLATMAVKLGSASYTGDDYLPGTSLVLCPKNWDGVQKKNVVYFSDSGCDVSAERAPAGFRGTFDFNTSYLEVFFRQSPGGPPVIGSYRCTVLGK